MLKGIGILCVMFIHICTITGVDSGSVVASLRAPIIGMFFLLSGYTSTAKKKSLPRQIGRNAWRLLKPYYLCSAAILVMLAIIYLGIEKKSATWFLDGTLGILFQLQSFHYFDPVSSGFHPMFYTVLIGWFLFQMVVSQLLFTPLLHALHKKKSFWKLLWALILLATGAVFYVLNLQGLNEAFFPTVCKIFILPNIFGIAGLMMLGNYLASLSLLDFDRLSPGRKAFCLLTLPVIAVFVLTDDRLYDFPIGKWGPFGPFSYFLTPVFAIALVLLLGVGCNLAKRLKALKRILLHYGRNSMDYLLVHFPIAFLVAYIGGFWYNFLSDPIPKDGAIGLHFVILLIAVPALSYPVAWLHSRLHSRKAQ